MDFDLIDKLSDEELTSLYNDAITDGITDGVHTGACNCYTPSGSIFTFGYNDNDCGGFCGGCEMLQSHGLYSYDACKSWCRGHGFSLHIFMTSCGCLHYGERNGTYGNIDRCGT